MTTWTIRVSVAIVTMVLASGLALSTDDHVAAFLMAFGAGAAGMRLLYLFDPTVNR